MHYELPPASYLEYKNGSIRSEKYWNLSPKINYDLSESKAINKLNNHLTLAVKRQLVSDVPIGVYLSGGMDSSSIVQKMHALGTVDINTFTLGFNEPTDEFPDAKLIADHFGTFFTLRDILKRPCLAMCESM